MPPHSAGVPTYDESLCPLIRTVSGTLVQGHRSVMSVPRGPLDALIPLECAAC